MCPGLSLALRFELSTDRRLEGLEIRALLTRDVAFVPAAQGFHAQKGDRNIELV
jgi:hypothetical protein